MRVAKRSEYSIGFTGLQDGLHDFHFEVGDTFFEQLEFSIIEGGSLQVNVQLEKQPTMITVNFTVDGTVRVMCDKCTDYFDLPIEGSDEVIYKFSDEELDDEKIRTIGSAETDIDITLPIYEFTALCLPQRRLHPEGECNDEMLEAMEDYLMVEATDEENTQEATEEENEEIDPRWNALKQLKGEDKK